MEKLQREEDGRKKITSGPATSPWASPPGQAWGISTSIEGVAGRGGHAGWGFRITTAFVLTVGGVFIMWLGEQITERGLGNGMSLLIFFSIVEGGWPAIGKTVQYLKTGAVDWPRLIVLASIMLVVVWVTVAITAAATPHPDPDPAQGDGPGPDPRRTEVVHPAAARLRRRDAHRVRAVNHHRAGHAGAVLQRAGPEGPVRLPSSPARWVYYVLYGVLIVFFTYFYTAIIFNPVDLAGEPEKRAGSSPA